jgi:hypothetical protein
MGENVPGEKGSSVDGRMREEVELDHDLTDRELFASRLGERFRKGGQRRILRELDIDFKDIPSVIAPNQRLHYTETVHDSRGLFMKTYK